MVQSFKCLSAVREIRGSDIYCVQTGIQKLVSIFTFNLQMRILEIRRGDCYESVDRRR